MTLTTTSFGCSALQIETVKLDFSEDCQRPVQVELYGEWEVHLVKFVLLLRRSSGEEDQSP